MRDNGRPSSNVSFHFFSNTAAVEYTDIYTTSIEPCNTLCDELIRGSNTSFFFKEDCLGKFMFSNSRKHVVTSPKNFTIDFIGTVMPGIAAPLKITQNDEIGNDVSKIFPFTARVRISRLNTKVASYLNNSLVLLGFPGDEGELLLESPTYTLIVRFQLTFCGPGFIFHNDSLKCTCLSDHSY